MPIPVSIQGVVVAPNDSILLSAAASIPSAGFHRLNTDLTITLVSGGDCPVDANGDRTITLADINAILGNWGAICP